MLSLFILLYIRIIVIFSSSDSLVTLHESFLKVKGVVPSQDVIVHLKA